MVNGSSPRPVDPMELTENKYESDPVMSLQKKPPFIDQNLSSYDFISFQPKLSILMLHCLTNNLSLFFLLCRREKRWPRTLVLLVITLNSILNQNPKLLREMKERRKNGFRFYSFILYYFTLQSNLYVLTIYIQND